MSRGAASGTKRAHHVRRLWRRGPRRALCAALDLYVRGLTGCVGHIPAGAAFGYYPTFDAARPSCFASPGREQQRHRHPPAAVPRSHSVAGAVAMAWIDEDGPCDFASAAAAARRRVP